MTAGSSSWTNGPLPVVEPEILGSLLAATSDLAFVVSDRGKVVSVLIDSKAKDHARIEKWVNRPMQDVLTVESVPKFERAIAAVSKAGQLDKRVELNHADGGDNWQYPVRYSFHRVGPDKSILMLGQDLRSVAETQDQLMQAQIALERGYEERREHDARYRVLMATTREAFVFVSADGRIRDLNTVAATLLGSEVDQLKGVAIAKELRHSRRGELIEALQSAATSDFDNELTVQAARTHRELSLVPSVFRAAGERLIICRLAVAGGDRHADDQLRKDLDALFHRTTDGIVFCDAKGVITGVNEGFLELADIPNMSDVKTRSLADFLQRGQVDLSVILENTARAGHMRMYSTRLANDYGARAMVEISSVSLSDQDRGAFGFVIRDGDRAMAIRKATQPANQAEAPNRNVVELVGSANLKEIVAETSDVIEKMCIETAIELTRNNRAAAAEMLGVSRQSLYVKLRKYDLLKRDDD